MNKVSVSNLTKIYKMYNKPAHRVLEALRLTKKTLHTDFYAVSDISFEIGEGEILGVMGRNGSGKSTLLKMLTGILTPSYGSILVKGRISSLLELGAGFNFEYSGIENIYFYGALMGITGPRMDERLGDIIAFAEIGDYIEQPVKTYSSGMFARLAFSCAVNVEPDVLIVDEILSVGDIRFQAKCFNKFKDFKERGVTIIYVGHDISAMRSFCDTCMWINDGRIVEIGEPSFVSSKYVEFMYKADNAELSRHSTFNCENIAEDKAVLKNEINFHADNESAESVNGIPADIAPDVVSEGFPADKAPADYELTAADKKPLAHWGTRLGSVKNIRFMDSEGNDTEFVSPGDTVTISFDVITEGMDYDNMSAAFSIKNREGIDLIVQTTYDKGMKFYNGTVHIEFSLKMRLNKGGYYLVIALENRENKIVSYYEYIEGAKYFSVFMQNDVSGLFLDSDIIVNIF